MGADVISAVDTCSTVCHHPIPTVKGNVVRTNVYHKYIKDLKLNIIIDLDGFIY